MFGYGGNPSIQGPHTSIVADPAFTTEMDQLRPRYIRVSIGRADNPPDTDYYSTDTDVLKNLNSIAGEFNERCRRAIMTSRSLIPCSHWLVNRCTAFITMDYMPFTLSSDTTRNIRVPASCISSPTTMASELTTCDNGVWQVMYHLIKHCYDTYGVTYFEHWNEPDGNG